MFCCFKLPPHIHYHTVTLVTWQIQITQCYQSDSVVSGPLIIEIDYQIQIQELYCPPGAIKVHQVSSVRPPSEPEDWFWYSAHPH